MAAWASAILFQNDRNIVLPAWLPDSPTPEIVFPKRHSCRSGVALGLFCLRQVVGAIAPCGGVGEPGEG